MCLSAVPEGVRFTADSLQEGCDARLMRRALVLGGGGAAGIAWQVGLIAGLGREGIDLIAADVTVGTSSGSIAAVLMHSDVPPEKLLDQQLAAVPPRAKAPRFQMSALMGQLTELAVSASSPEEFRARVGAFARAHSPAISPADRRAGFAARLGTTDWPRSDLRIVAVDADTGAVAVFTRDSGVDIVEAASASCALPGVWPLVTIGDHTYIDGGARGATNADLVDDCEAVLVLAPLTPVPEGPLPTVDEEVAALRGRAAVHVIGPDEAYQKAVGDNPLDPRTFAPSARAGLALAARVAPDARRVWVLAG